jgi:CDP-glucose 4,6-dehydratase
VVDRSGTVGPLTMFCDIYSGKTVLVTGHTGFKGSWLTTWLLKLGANVVGYSLPPPTVPSLFESCRLAERITHIEGDVRDTPSIHAVLQKYRPDFVFHLAAQSLVRESYIAPRVTFDTNVMGTISVLEALRLEPFPCSFVVVSSDKCYQNNDWEFTYRETDPLGGHDPYSASKAATEIAVASYRSSFFPPGTVTQHGITLASARAGNVIGGGDWSKDRIVPDAIRALSEGRVLRVRNPASVRPWQHVLEPLSGYLWLAAVMSGPGGEQFASSWNFGPLNDEIHTVAELSSSIVAAWGQGAWHAEDEVSAVHETRTLRLAIDKAQLRLSWRPVWDFATAVRRTVAWYRGNLARPAPEKAYGACLEDIALYEVAATEKDLAWTS